MQVMFFFLDTSALLSAFCEGTGGKVTGGNARSIGGGQRGVEPRHCRPRIGSCVGGGFEA